MTSRGYAGGGGGDTGPHTHAEGDVTGLAADLAALDTELAGKAALVETVNTVPASGAAQALPDVTTATMHRVVLTANCTITLPAPGAGKSLTVVVEQDATGSRTLTWASPSGAVRWAGGTVPTWTTTASRRDVVTFACVDGANWIGSALLDVR